MKKVWSMFMLLAVCLVACTNIDDLEDDVDALKKRVTALETQVRDINSNTEALRELYNEGTFITNIEEKSDSYTLTLSNGKTVNLYMKMTITCYALLSVSIQKAIGLFFTTKMKLRSV